MTIFKQYVEHYLAPNDWLYILGTITINKDGTNHHTVIQRGITNPTFVISDFREKGVVKETQWEMVSSIVYGILIFTTGFLEFLYLSNILEGR